MSEKPVLILGGASDIGLAVARRFAAEGRPIQLAARRPDELEADRADLELRYGVPVSLHRFDALDVASHASFVAGLPVLPEVAVCAVGLLGNQTDCEQDSAAAVLVMRSNYEGPASMLAVLANHFERRGSGVIVGVSSVAGDRGRASNYVYGSAKSGFTTFLSGLRNRLSGRGVHVVTVKPGFVRTKMVDGLTLPRRLTAEPEEVAAAVVRAVRRRRDSVYVRPVWWAVMTVIALMPEAVFKRTRL